MTQSKKNLLTAKLFAASAMAAITPRKFITFKTVVQVIDFSLIDAEVAAASANHYQTSTSSKIQRLASDVNVYGRFQSADKG